MKYQIKRCTGGWYWRVVAKNHLVMCHSEVYKTRKSAEKAAIKVKMLSMYAPLVVEE